MSGGGDDDMILNFSTNESRRSVKPSVDGGNRSKQESNKEKYKSRVIDNRVRHKQFM